ncbi:MutS-related protein [Algoriphagus jejuensis]|uniref:MutS-related protein n=1 Tax=Algoriphagus jejuensis TaxID=419934 RepID=UPI0031D02B02
MRLLFFFGTGALFILGLAEHPLWLVAAGIATYFFIKLVSFYNFQKDQEAIYLALGKMEERKGHRQRRTLSGFDSGAEFSDKNHPFCNDLDLFGEHSLFQLLNHTVSKGGKARLASLMKSNFDKAESEGRAQAVTELADKALFLQAMEAAGLALKKDEAENGKWIDWLGSAEKQSVLPKMLAFIGPIGGLTLLSLIYLGIVPEAILGVWVLLGVGFLSLVFKPLKAAADAIPVASTLKSYLIRTKLIEQESFYSKTLNIAKSELSNEKSPASSLLGDLDSLGFWIQNRLNLLYLPFNLLFWTDFLIFNQLASWKNRVGQSLSHLPENLEKWEVFVSLGAFEVELEGAAKFEWTEEAELIATDISHPMILPEKAIPNSIGLDAGHRLVILTGANMSGKTTFMRTLGINCVLANLGLSPFGSNLRIGKIQLYTSMRNSDNLGESVSSFYAELKRIHTLIERLESGETLFFLLDEILKGTNTQDRISGSEALILQILKTKGLGIMSTHDIELSVLEQSVENLHNFSFHSEIHDRSIDFDYKIKKGPCPSFNAHKLMELMGIRFGNPEHMASKLGR